MEHWICVTCGTQFPQSQATPETCPICNDQRQYIGPDGQQWTTLAAMQNKGFHNHFEEHEPGIIGIGTEPKFAIGQRALLVQTEHGNILWDCISFLDTATRDKIQELGGITAIAISHPHFYTTMIAWAKHFDAPIYLHEDNKPYVMRPDKRITFWSGETHKLMDDVTLIRLGGHFSGSTVCHWASGAEGKGILFTGDTIQVVADRRWVSFMYSYPNLLPLPASTIRQMRDTIAAYPFERLYGMNFTSVVSENANAAVQRSANRYLRALEGKLPM